MANTTQVPVTMNTTEANALASIASYDNSEIELISIARGRAPLFHTIVDMGRWLNGGQYTKMGLNEKTTTNFPKYVWKEKDEFNKVYAAWADKTATDTTITLVKNNGLYAGLLLRDAATNEQMRVTSIVSGSTTDVVVQRWVGTVAAAAITTWDKISVVASASSRGQASLGAFWTEADERFNYIQKFLTTVSFDDFDNLAHYGAGKETFMQEASNQHLSEIENQMLFGQKAAGTDADGKPYYTMEWVIQNCLRGNVNDISGALSKETLEEALSYPFKYTKNGNTKKIGLCGTKVKSAITSLYTNMIRTTNIKEVDLTFDTLKVNRGEIVFVEHPLLDDDSGYADRLLVLDPSFLKIIYPTAKGIQGGNLPKLGTDGKTTFVVNQAKTNFAKVEGSFLTFLTLEASNSNAFAAIKVV